MFFLGLSFGISTVLLQILFFYDFLFIHPEASIGVLEKDIFQNFQNIFKIPATPKKYL